MPDGFFTEGEKPRVTREDRIKKALEGAEKDSGLLTEEVEKKRSRWGRFQKGLNEAKSAGSGILENEKRWKRWVGWLVICGVPATAILGGVVYGAHELLKKMLPQSFLSKPQEAEPQTYEQQQDRQMNTLRSDLSTGAIRFPELTDPAFVKDGNVIQLTAWAGGANGLFSTIDSSIGEIQPKFSEAVFNTITRQLNFDSSQQEWLRSNWDALSRDPALAMKLLNGAQFPGHQADPAVIKFYQCTIDVYNKDIDKTSWQDRIPGVQACSTQATSALTGEIKHGLPGVAKVKWTNEGRVQEDSNFNELVARVDAETGGVVGQMLGPLETLANMPIDTTATHEAAAVDMAEFYQHESQKPLLVNTGLPLILTGLFLLRVGPSWSRAAIAKASERLEDVYYWFKLGQHERVMRNLTVLGKQAHERVAGRKINQEVSQ